MDGFIHKSVVNRVNFRDFEYTEVKIYLYPEEAKGRWFLPHTIKCLKLQSNFDLGLHWRVNSEGVIRGYATNSSGKPTRKLPG